MLKREWWKLGVVMMLSALAIVPCGCAARRRAREARKDVVLPPDPPASWSDTDPQTSALPVQKPLLQ